MSLERIASRGARNFRRDSTAKTRNSARVGPTAVRETILRDGGRRNFGETGRGEVAVPIEVGPESGQPDQTGRAGEMGVYLINSGEFDGGFGLPSSRLPCKHPSTFSGQKD